MRPHTGPKHLRRPKTGRTRRRRNITNAGRKSRTDKRTGVSRILHAVKVKRIFIERPMRPRRLRHLHFHGKPRPMFHRTHLIVERVVHHKNPGVRPGRKLSRQFRSFFTQSVLTQNDGIDGSPLLQNHLCQVRPFGKRHSQLFGSPRTFGNFLPTAKPFVGGGGNQ